jgi:5'-nucleotidase
MFVLLTAMRAVFAQLLALTALVASQKIVLTNDDGWAVAQIRDEYNQLKAAGFEANTFLPC